eukprot:Rmarinus@m.23640
MKLAFIPQYGKAVRPQSTLCSTGIRRSQSQSHISNINRVQVFHATKSSSNATTLSHTDLIGHPDQSQLPIRVGDDSLVDSTYTYWRLRVFFAMFTAYSVFYFTRSSFVFVSPILQRDLGWTLDQIGMVTSIFPIMYGMSKFLSGIISDVASAGVVMGVGLILTGVVNILFAEQTSLIVMCLLWAMNGLFQGAGSPGSAKLLTTWYSKQERGTWWGFWNTSHNVGGFLIPLIAGYAANTWGWRYGMRIPGAIALLVGLCTVFLVRDRPEEVGLPPVEQYHGAKGETHSKEGPTPAAPKLSKELFYKYVLGDWRIVLMGMAYFFVYFVRQGITYWSHHYLIQAKGVAAASEAAMRVSGFELGGLCGSLLSGYLSDKVFKGRRMPVALLYMLFTSIFIALFWAVPAGYPWLDWISVSLIGFFIYGPQMLVGLAGAEITHPAAVSTATGLLGWIAYVGAASSGLPLTKIVQAYGWGAYFTSLLTCCIIACALMAPLWSVDGGEKKAEGLVRRHSRTVPCGCELENPVDLGQPFVLKRMFVLCILYSFPFFFKKKKK